MINKKITIDGTILLKNANGVGASRITEGFQSPNQAEAITRAAEVGYKSPDKYSHSGEFCIDIIGETDVTGANIQNGKYVWSEADSLRTHNTRAHVSLDVNGYPRRAAAVSGLINVKPSFGTVSRYGVLPIATSADTVTVTAASVSACRELLEAISGYDEKDTLTLRNEACPLKNGSTATTVKRIGVPFNLISNVDREIQTRIRNVSDRLASIGIETADLTKEETELFTIAHAAWNTVLCSQLWGNLSRYDGIRYGRRAEGYEDLRELYERSRSEGFGALIKNAILYGSFALSPDSGDASYFNAEKARKQINAKVNSLFERFDLIMLPACSVPYYTEESIKSGILDPFKENLYTALPSLCTLPTVTVNGIQIIGKHLSDVTLLAVAEQLTSTNVNSLT